MPVPTSKTGKIVKDDFFVHAEAINGLEVQVGDVNAHLEKRNPLLQPFSGTSIWNTPIGDGAVRVAAGLAATTGSSGRITVDPIYIGMNTVDPLKTLSTATTTTATNGVTLNTVTPNYTIPDGTQVHVPPALAHNGVYNGIACFVRPGGLTFTQGQTLYLTAGGNPSWAYTLPTPADASTLDQSLYGEGMYGAHAGSGLSGLGGVLREHEWRSSEPIRHALSINLYGSRFLSTAGGGYRWPANRSDSGYNNSGSANYYGRTGSGYDGMRMGSLLALPRNYDIAAITDSRVRRIATAMRDFGAYVADNTARDVHAVSMQSTIQTEWAAAGATFHSELMAVFTALELVDNNAADAVGGGGTRIAIAPVALGDSAPIKQVYADSSGRVSETAQTTRTVRKVADTAHTNTATLASDPHLAFTVAAGEQIHFRALLIVEQATGGGTTTDLKVAWSLPTGVTGSWGAYTIQPGAAGAQAGMALGPYVASTAFATAEGTQLISFEGVFTFANAGTVALQVAQNTANAAATTLKAGSHLRLTRLSA